MSFYVLSWAVQLILYEYSRPLLDAEYLASQSVCIPFTHISKIFQENTRNSPIFDCSGEVITQFGKDLNEWAELRNQQIVSNTYGTIEQSHERL